MKSNQRPVVLVTLILCTAAGAAVAAAPGLAASILDTPSIIRMHVRADSDQPEAQYVKELVSRDLVAYLSTRGLATASNLPEAVALLETELARIEEVARAVLPGKDSAPTCEQVSASSTTKREKISGSSFPPENTWPWKLSWAAGKGRTSGASSFRACASCRQRLRIWPGSGPGARSQRPHPDRPSRLWTR